MPLNINLQQILLHALNFVILFGAMYFLLYKPVKSFMDSRKAHYEKMDEDANNVRGEERVISATDSKVKVLLIPTNEELMIAMDTAAIVKG